MREAIHDIEVVFCSWVLASRGMLTSSASVGWLIELELGACSVPRVLEVCVSIRAVLVPTSSWVETTSQYNTAIGDSNASSICSIFIEVECSSLRRRHFLIAHWLANWI